MQMLNTTLCTSTLVNCGIAYYVLCWMCLNVGTEQPSFFNVQCQNSCFFTISVHGNYGAVKIGERLSNKIYGMVRVRQ